MKKYLYLLGIFLVGIVISKDIYKNYQEEIIRRHLLATRPTHIEVINATKSCVPTKSIIAKNVKGISEPRLHEESISKLVANSGIKWVRAEFKWDKIESTLGVYQLDDYDKMVHILNSGNVSILGTVNYLPTNLTDWQSIYTAYGKLLERLVQRYRPDPSHSKIGISYWEIFNEPNSPGFGWFDGREYTKHRGKDYVEAYVSILAESNKIIRENDPSAIIVLGGLSPDGYPPFNFLEDIYALGAKECFDVIAFHPYAYSNNFSGAMSELRKIASKSGDGLKPIWFDEYGTTDNEHRLQIASATIAQKNIPDGLFWYTFIDYSASKYDSWGFLKADGSKKAEYGLLHELLN